MVASQMHRLQVFSNGSHIGQLAKSASGGLSFVYAEKWLDTAQAHPLSLSLPLMSKAFSGELVYNFFDNLLPDNRQTRARLQTKFHLTSNHPFDLLASIGRDCIGAVQIMEASQASFSQSIKSTPLTDEAIANILKGYQANPLGMQDNTADFRISIAGVQEKTALLYHNEQWQMPLGATPTTHIFKLPIGVLPYQQLDLTDSCENEWLCSQIAKAFGLEVADCNIHIFEDTKALVVERFDRRFIDVNRWIMRLPQEDVCQALGISSNLKYQAEGGPGISTIMDLLLGSVDSQLNRDNFFRAQVLFWLLCAIDGHAKNFSLFIEPGGKYRLTPLYDVMSAFPLIEKKQLAKQKAKMAMALRGKNLHYRWYQGQYRHFIETAKHARYTPKRAEQILAEMLAQVESVIEHVSQQLPQAFPEALAQATFNGMRAMRNRLSIK